MMKKFIMAFIVALILTGCSGPAVETFTPSEIKAPYVDSEGVTVYPYGNKVDLEDWSIEVLSYTTKGRLDGVGNKYFAAADGYLFYILEVNVTNNSDTNKQFVPTSSALNGGVDIALFALGSDDDVYGIVNEITLKEKTVGTSVPAGETVKMNIPFHIDGKLVDEKALMQAVFVYTPSSMSPDAEKPYVIISFE